MLDEPDDWTLTVRIAEGSSLVRKEGTWTLEGPYGYWSVPVPDSVAEHIVLCNELYHNIESYTYRHSFSFRWMRFWYRIKKRRYERHLKREEEKKRSTS